MSGSSTQSGGSGSAGAQSNLTSSPSSTTSTLSAVSADTLRPRRTSPSRSPSPSPSAPPGRKASQKDSPSRPSLLCPPATVISPPSPVEPSTGTLPTAIPVPSDSPQVYSSPPVSTPDEMEGGGGAGDRGGLKGKEEWNWSTPPPKLSAGRKKGSYGAVGRAATTSAASAESSPRPLAATQLSLPPQSMSPASSASSLPGTPDAGPSHPQPNLGRRDSLAVPIPALSPGRTPGSEGETFFSASPFSSPGLPMPSSPQAYPKTPGHRRHSSTHRVKETPNGHQRSTEDGETMINEYKIGKPLGKGGFAKVELAVHVGTGEEYAIKEFSQSRLRTQSLLEKRRVTMNRKLRGRGRGRGGTPSGGRPIPARRCSMSGSDGSGDGSEASGSGSGTEKKEKKAHRERASSEPDANDPLGLIRREIAVMKKLDHPNIVKLTEAISVPNADALYLVLEYMPGGVLMHIKMGEEAGEPPFGIEQAREYFRQLILGLEYLHGNGVVHRDIKPDNILLSRDHTTVKLCDFGVSEMFEVADSDDRIKRSGGSPAFLSPESFTSHAHEVHGKLVDIWALGVTLYCMFTGVLPFNTENPIELFDKVRHEEPTIPDEWPGDQQDLIRQMLRKEPSFRIHMFLLREHPWVTEDGANPMISREDNMTHVGKIVEEPTEQEISAAIRVKGAFTVIRAVQKLKRMAGISTSPKPSPPIRNSTLDSITSGTRTGTTGSMDSYVSEMPTEDTSMEDEEQRGWRESTVKGPEEEDEGVAKVGSPEGMDKGHKVDAEIPALKLDTGTATLKLPERGERPSSPGQLLGNSPSTNNGAPAADAMARGMAGLRVGLPVTRKVAEGSDDPLVGTPTDEDDDSGFDQAGSTDADVKEGEEVQMVDSPVDGDEEEVQIMDSPVEEEEEVVEKAKETLMRSIKGKPRPRPAPRP